MLVASEVDRLAQRLRRELGGGRVTKSACQILVERSRGGRRTSIFLEADRDGWTVSGWVDVDGFETDYLGGAGGGCLLHVEEAAVNMARFAATL